MKKTIRIYGLVVAAMLGITLGSRNTFVRGAGALAPGTVGWVGASEV